MERLKRCEREKKSAESKKVYAIDVRTMAFCERVICASAHEQEQDKREKNPAENRNEGNCVDILFAS